VDVELTVALDEEGVVEEGVVVEDVGIRVLDDWATELLLLVAELTDTTELVDAEVGVVIPPDDGADAR